VILLFADGACSGNPGPGGWACIAVLPGGDVRELGGREAPTTNNRMELGGVIAGLRAVSGRPEPVVVHSDSTYVLGGITSWIQGWKRRGWKTAAGEPVKNEDLWRELDALVAARGRGGVEWRWVKGHSGHDANERCDAIAVAFSRGRPIDLYAGPLLSYPHGSLAPSEAKPLPAKRASARASAPSSSGPATYLSLLDGKLERHATWRECESRVKGRSGARFKKVKSSAEERETLSAWGLGA
jgi:ribonuclease HI